jgi:hypothetical protein
MDQESKNVQCATCGEIFQLDERFSVGKAPCPACGSIGAVDLGVIEVEEPPLQDLEPPPEPPPPSPPPEYLDDEEL